MALKDEMEAHDQEMREATERKRRAHKAEVLARFTRTSPTDTADLEDKIAQTQDNNTAFRNLAEYLVDHVPAGRCLSEALTALQTAKFFANEATITGK